MSTEFTEEWLAEYQRRRNAAKTEPGPKLPECQPITETTIPRKRNKYGNKKTNVNGIPFDSKHEAQCYETLELCRMAGEIRAVLTQAAFLLPGGVKYIADFVTLNTDGTYSVLDAKSPATRKDKVYRLKKRLMKNCLGIEIEEV